MEFFLIVQLAKSTPVLTVFSPETSISIRNQPSTLSKLYSIWEEVPKNFLDVTDIDSYFYHSILDISTVKTRLVCLSKASNKSSSTFEVFTIHSSKLQQRYFPVEDTTSTKQNLAPTLYCLNNFLDQYEKAKNSNYYSLPTPKNAVRYTFSKDDLFCQHIHQTKKHPKRHINLSSRLQQYNK